MTDFLGLFHMPDIAVLCVLTLVSLTCDLATIILLLIVENIEALRNSGPLFLLFLSELTVQMPFLSPKDILCHNNSRAYYISQLEL